MARQFWQTGASGDSRHRTFLARQASHALTGLVRFLGSVVTGDAEDCSRAERADEASCVDASCDDLEGPAAAAAATEAKVSAAAMMADEVIRAWVSVLKVCDEVGKPITVACCSRGERGIQTTSAKDKDALLSPRRSLGACCALAREMRGRTAEMMEGGRGKSLATGVGRDKRELSSAERYFRRAEQRGEQETQMCHKEEAEKWGDSVPSR